MQQNFCPAVSPAIAIANQPTNDYIKAMRTFSIHTLGCKVNQYESQQIRELLETLGLAQADAAAAPDLAVVNTCCVTATASAKARQCIRKIAKQNPNAAIVVAGCLPGVETGELNNLDVDVHLLKDRADLAPTLHQLVNGNGQSGTSELPPLKSFSAHTRAFLKVQDGCDGYCTYCIVPKTRPNIKSRTIESILDEAKSLIDAGHKEIVLTGIFLGAFGRDTVRRKNWPGGQNPQLALLLDKLAQLPHLPRIRLSSLEPHDLTERLLDVFCAHSNIMPHLHLSLQSGSDAVLKRMCRQYRAAEFLEKVAMAKQRLDIPAITTDIIVGFPGETQADFDATAELARRVGFAKMHVFSFSPRKGTAATAMKDKIRNAVITKRSKILRRLDAELGYEFRRQFIGTIDTVLLERDNGRLQGRSRRYFTVHVLAQNLTHNDLVTVKLIDNTKDAAVGLP